jgi:K+/H+ antiporter YhaU regulatory subunit KhtT
MMERQVIGTMSIGRAVLMIAEVPVSASAPLTGRPIGAANEPGQARVIALRHHDGNDLDWAPTSTDPLRPLDRLIVVATQAGLGRLLARSMAPVPSGNGDGGRGSDTHQ